MGLNRRTLLAGGLLALLVGLTSIVVLQGIGELRAAGVKARHSEQVLAAVNRLERLVIDLETGLRGFVITGDERFLEPWKEARQRLPEQAATLHRLAAARSVEQGRRAEEIAQAANSYLQEYSVPTVESARRDPASVRTVALTLEGKRLVDGLRARFDRFVEAEDVLAAQREHHAGVVAHRATVTVAARTVGTIVLVGLFIAYLTRTIVRPVRRAAAMAGRLAAGDLAVRVPESSPAEIGALEQAFNSMGASLEASDRELRRLLEEIAVSRARVIAAADEARRRIERDLHDGTQQRLVSLALDLRGTTASVPPELVELRAQLAQVSDGLGAALADLQEVARGIHPAILARGGVEPALQALGRRSSVPVQLHVSLERRLPERVEVAIYYVVSEALTNVAKHARASVVRVDLKVRGATTRLEIDDDGVGGATPSLGSGLIGLRDRIEALGGTIDIASPKGSGTTLRVEIPLAG